MKKRTSWVFAMLLMGCATVVEDPDLEISEGLPDNGGGATGDGDPDLLGSSGGASQIFGSGGESSGGTTFGSSGGSSSGGNGTTSSGGTTGSTGGASSSGGAPGSGGTPSSGGAPVGTGSCEGVPIWSNGVSDDSVATCTAMSQVCIQTGGEVGKTYKFTCTVDHKPNCGTQDPGSTNWADPPWAVVEECVE